MISIRTAYYLNNGIRDGDRRIGLQCYGNLINNPNRHNWKTNTVISQFYKPCIPLRKGRWGNR